jgi:hypothetical protein
VQNASSRGFKVAQRQALPTARFLLGRKKPPYCLLYGPATGRIAWDLYKAIDWTHIHHEQTYDILSDRRIPWDRKKEVTDRAVRYYLQKDRIARSPAPLDVTMRRAAVMMKPYFTRFRNYYPQSNNFFFAAHWWHPAVYEAQMIGGLDTSLKFKRARHPMWSKSA